MVYQTKSKRFPTRILESATDAKRRSFFVGIARPARMKIDDQRETPIRAVGRFGTYGCVKKTGVGLKVREAPAMVMAVES